MLGGGETAFFDANKAALLKKLDEAMRTSSKYEIIAERYLWKKQEKSRRLS